MSCRIFLAPGSSSAIKIVCAIGDTASYRPVPRQYCSKRPANSLLLSAAKERRNFKVRVRNSNLGGRASRSRGSNTHSFGAAVETGGNDGDLHFAFHGFIQNGAEDDVCFDVCGIMDDIR